MGYDTTDLVNPMSTVKYTAHVPGLSKLIKNCTGEEI